MATKYAIRANPDYKAVFEEQLQDNVGTFDSTESFSDEDEALLMEVCEKFRSQIVVPCTACRYCCDGCPAKINIPEYLRAYNAGKAEEAGEAKSVMAKIETVRFWTSRIRALRTSWRFPVTINPL